VNLSLILSRAEPVALAPRPPEAYVEPAPSDANRHPSGRSCAGSASRVIPMNTPYATAGDAKRAHVRPPPPRCTAPVPAVKLSPSRPLAQRT